MSGLVAAWSLWLACAAPNAPSIVDRVEPNLVLNTLPQVAHSMDHVDDCSWDTLGFNIVVDSMMSLAHHRHLHFAVSERRYTSRGASDHFPGAVMQGMAKEVHGFEFRDPDRSRNAHVEMALACFTSDSAAKGCFERLWALGSYEEQGPPGLTYTNDDVRLLGNEIAWINSTCRLSSMNHRKLAGLLMERLGFGEASFKLECECGGTCGTRK